MERLKRSIQIGDLKPAEGDQEKYGTEFQASRGGCVIPAALQTTPYRVWRPETWCFIG